MAENEFPNKNWMKNLPKSVRDMSVINITIPGSHNSMTYGITNNSEVSPDADLSVRRLYRFFPCFVRRWSITQSIGITDQLCYGVRYFDLRICTKNYSQFYFAHGLFAMEIFKPLNEINDFLNQNPEEIVILDFQHFYGLTVQHHKQLQYDIKRIFEKKIFGRNNGTLNQCTLNLCHQLKKQVIIIYRRYPTLPIEFWPEEFWPTPWPNTCSVKKLKKYLEQSLENRDPNTGYVSQCILTPNSKYITFRIYSSLKRTARKVEKDLSDWIIHQHCGEYEPNKPTANVFLADFIHILNGDFCKKVINLNNINSEVRDCNCEYV